MLINMPRNSRVERLRLKKSVNVEVEVESHFFGSSLRRLMIESTETVYMILRGLSVLYVTERRVVPRKRNELL